MFVDARAVERRKPDKWRATRAPMRVGGSGARVRAMSHTYRTRVIAGRLLLDEPTTLPDGAEVELIARDILEGATERAAERARLQAFLTESIRLRDAPPHRSAN